MKKFLLCLVSVFMIFVGVSLTGCGEPAAAAVMTLESDSFSDDKKNYVAIDVTDQKTITIKATIENQKDGRISVSNDYQDKLEVSSVYNANLNVNTISLKAVEEGMAEIIITPMSGNVEQQKISVFIYSDITGLSQKADDGETKKTQYIEMDKDIELTADRYLNISSRDTCNKKDIVWSLESNYGASLTLNGNVLRLDSARFKAFQQAQAAEGRPVPNQIYLKAASKFVEGIETLVSFDVLQGVQECFVGTDYVVRSNFDNVANKQEDGAKISNELVITNDSDEHAVLYAYVKVKSVKPLTWIQLTDQELANYGVPAGTLDITQDAPAVFNAADSTYFYRFKIVKEGSVQSYTYNINFSFAYDEYDYVYETKTAFEINLVEVVTSMSVLDDKQNAFDTASPVNIYNYYANGKGQFFGTNLYPITANDTSYYVRFKINKSTVEAAGFDVKKYISIKTEGGTEVELSRKDGEEDLGGYCYYYSMTETAGVKSIRYFANVSGLYVKATTSTSQPGQEFYLEFVSRKKTEVQTALKLNFLYAPQQDFLIKAQTGYTLQPKIETSSLVTKQVRIQCENLLNVAVEDLYLSYPKNNAYEINNITKDSEDHRKIQFDVVLKQVGFSGDVDVVLYHKNGYKSTSAVTITFFKSLSQASLVLLNSSSSNISYYRSVKQNFGQDVAYVGDNSLNEIMVTAGTTFSLELLHNAGESLKEIKPYFFVCDQNGIDKNAVNVSEFYENIISVVGFDTKQTATFFNYNLRAQTITVKSQEFKGYVVFEFIGYNAEYVETKIYRAFYVESYVPVSTLSAKSTLVEVTASDSLSVGDSELLSKKAMEVKFRPDSLKVSYYGLVEDSEHEILNKEQPIESGGSPIPVYLPYLNIYSTTAVQADSKYTWNSTLKELRNENGELIYRIEDVTSSNGRVLSFVVNAASTSGLSEFVDTIVVQYTSFNAEFRLGIDIKITNSERVSSVIWENQTDDGKIYLLQTAKNDPDVDENRATIITTVAEAYNTNLVYKYNAISGNTNVVLFENNGKHKDIVANKDVDNGGCGYLYILPEDAVKFNGMIHFNYIQDEVLKSGSVALEQLNNEKPGEEGKSWYDYLIENAFFLSTKGVKVYYSDIIVRIYVVVADGLSEDTAIRIYTENELLKIKSFNYYILMNDVEIYVSESLFPYKDTSSQQLVGGLEGASDDVTITYVEKDGKISRPLIDAIGAAGFVKNLHFNGNVQGGDSENENRGYVGFVARRNAGLIDNVVIDVYEDDIGFCPSSVTSQYVNAKIGGIVGYNQGTISNSKVQGVDIAVSEIGQNAGGIAGENLKNITNCYVEIYKFNATKTNQIGSAVVPNAGGIVGYDDNGTISGCYVYDYSITKDSTDSNIVAKNYKGALIGYEQRTAKISNSFAFVGFAEYIGNGMGNYADSYISIYNGVGEDRHIVSDKTQLNSSLWTTATDAEFDETINGGDDYLKFHQAKAIMVEHIVFNDGDSFVKLADKSAALFLYEIDSQDTLTKVEKTALSHKNTYELSTLFDGVGGNEDYVVVSSSDPTIIKTKSNGLEVLKAGKVTITLLSKQDFSASAAFTIDVVHVIADYKAQYNGKETTGIEVQEGKSAQIDFTFLDKTYLNTAREFDLVLDNFAVKTSTVGSNIDGYLFSVENNVGQVTILDKETPFVLDAYVCLNSAAGLNETELSALNTKLATRFKKELTITPFKGTNFIGADYSAITLSPALSTSLNVLLRTDSDTDKLDIAVEINGIKLITADGKTSITEIGAYELSYGSTGNRLKVNVTRDSYDDVNKQYVYRLTFSVCDEYKSKIAATEQYSIVLNALNDKSKTLQKIVKLNVESQAIDNVDLATYLIGPVAIEGGKQIYTRSQSPVTLVSPGTSVILEATIDPKFSYYEYLTISYVPQNNGLLSFTSLTKQGDGRYLTDTVSSVTNIAYGVKIVPINKTSTFAFKVYVTREIESNCVFPITVSFFGKNAEGNIVELENSQMYLYVSYQKQPRIAVNGDDFAKIAKGAEALVTIDLESEQELDAVTFGGDVQGVYLNFISRVFNDDGTQTYTYRLAANVTSTVGGNPVGQFGITATVARYINNIRETKSMTVSVVLVEIDPIGLSLEDYRYDENLDLDVFTAYEKLNANFEFSYKFEPEAYSLDSSSAAVKALKEKRTELNKFGYYKQDTYYINYEYSEELVDWVPVPTKDRLYVVGSNGREQKITWQLVDEHSYAYTYFDGNFARFRIIYNEEDNTFVVYGNSTTANVVRMRIKNATYLTSGGKDLYWENTYDFGIEVKSYVDEDTPYEINSAAEFLNINGQGQPAQYILMSDIVLENYAPIPTTENVKSFDGNGYTIHINSFNLEEQEGTLNLALFSQVSPGTMLKNVRVNLYDGGKIEVDVDRFTAIQIAGIAISNEGIIYNSEVVAYNDERFNHTVGEEHGIVVSYKRNGSDYSVDGNSEVNSVVAGFVINNAGNISNSRVGGESIKVITRAGLGNTYYKDIALGTFTISAQKEINGFVSKNNGNISASKATSVQLTNYSSYNLFETAGFVNTNSGRITTSYVTGTPREQDRLAVNGSNISSSGIVAGFVITNATSGTIENALSNIPVATTSLFGAGFVYRNDGKIAYSFSASQVQNSTYTQMTFAGLDKNGNLLSNIGKIEFSYYYDVGHMIGQDKEQQMDTGASYIDLTQSNVPEVYYGFSFASGKNEEEMIENEDGIWYIKESGRVSILSADTISYSSRYLASSANEMRRYTYCDMIDDGDSIHYGERFTTQYGSRYNPIVISTAQEFNDAMGNSKSTVISKYFNTASNEVFGSYRIVKDLDFDELDKTEKGNVSVCSTSRFLTTQEASKTTIEGRGRIDGNGYTIMNVSIASSEDSDNGGQNSFGLFAGLKNNAVIHNLNMKVSNVTADDIYVVGSLAGVVYNSHVVNVAVEQKYSADLGSGIEASGVGVLGRNIAGGVIGVVSGQSNVRNIKISNAATQTAYHSGSRGETNKEYYLNNINLRTIRTNMISTQKNLSTFKDFSIAGGIIGFVDVFEYDRRTNVNYIHTASDGQRIFRLQNLSADTTVNVRGEIAGGLFGYTGPATALDNISLVLTTEENDGEGETNTLISKILASNSYAGGITGLGSGYYKRVVAEHDAATQKAIEESYDSFYNGDTADRGILNLFYTVYDGIVQYDYNPQIIGGLIGVMKDGVIANSYSKINVIAKDLSRATAGGIIGKVKSTSTPFSYIMQAFTPNTTSANVLLQEVYATGDVKGGFDKDVQQGFAGGIVGELDANSVLTMEAVNAVNAFSYDNILTKPVEGKDKEEGELSSVGVYAFVGGNENTRGIVRIVAPQEYDQKGNFVAASKKTLGYFKTLKTPSSEINITTWPGHTNVDYKTSIDGSMGHDVDTEPFPIIFAGEFSDIEDGYNKVFSSFIGGKHWDPTKWKHTSKHVYPEINFNPQKTVIYLDNYGEYSPEKVLPLLHNSKLEVRVRGLCKDGTYANVSLEGKIINGFSGTIVGPTGWLTEEELEKGKIGKGKNGEYIGISVNTPIFNNVGIGFVAKNLTVLYGADGEDKNEGEGFTRLTDSAPTSADGSGGMFINGKATGISILDVIFKISMQEINISSVGGNVGFLCPIIVNSRINDLKFIISKPESPDDNKYSIIFRDSGDGEKFNAGLIAGQLNMDKDSSVTNNTVEISGVKNVIDVQLAANRAFANVGSLFGSLSAHGEVNTKGFGAGCNLINISGLSHTTEDSVLNVGGQIGKLINNSSATLKTRASSIATLNETAIAKIIINLVGNVKKVNYGGIVGEISNLTNFTVSDSGYIALTELKVTQKTDEGITLKTIDNLTAGGVFGYIAAGSNFSIGSNSGDRLKSYFKLYKDAAGTVGGNIGGVVGQTNTTTTISGLESQIEVGGKNGIFDNLNANIGGVISQNSSILTIKNVKTLGNIRAAGSTSAYVSGIVALNAGEVTIGGNDNNVISEVNIYTGSGIVGGIVAYVGTAATTTIQNVLYTGTIQLYGSNNKFEVGGIIGQANSRVSITDAVTGGNIYLKGTVFEEGAEYDFENTEKLYIASNAITLYVGGILGNDASASPSTIIDSYAYGDLIVRYGGDFQQIGSLFCGGILGYRDLSGTTTIQDCVSAFTCNNDRKATSHHVGVFAGQGASLSGINKYSSALSLCTDETANVTEYGYNTVLDATRGFNTSKETTNDEGAINTIIKLIGKKLTTFKGITYNVGNEPKGSKLNPYVLNGMSSGHINPSTPIVYIAMNGNCAALNHENFPIQKFYTDGNCVYTKDSAQYASRLALIGEGYTLTIENEGGEANISFFDTMEQNNIVSSVVLNITADFDLENATTADEINSTRHIAPIANNMMGGIIYATGVNGTYSVGSNNFLDVAGLVGNMTHGTISNCYTDVNVINRGRTACTDGIGKTAGFVNFASDSDYAWVEDSFSIGRIETYSTTHTYMFAGGESTSRAKLSNCYTASVISVNDYTCEINNTSVEKKDYYGTLVNCLTDSTVASGITTSGTSKTTADLALNYAGTGSLALGDMAGWVNSYTTGAFYNYGYPTRKFAFLKRTTTKEIDEKVYHVIPNVGKFGQIGSALSLNYLLDCDITTTSGHSDKTYTGIFDGNGHAIIGLTSNLFNVLSGATVKDLRLLDVNITFSDAAHHGALANSANGATITNVSVSGNITSTYTDGYAVGGLVGWVNEVGDNKTTTFENCKNYAKITREKGILGGILGQHSSGTTTFTGCTNYGVLEIKQTGSIGGILGEVFGSETEGVGEVEFSQCGNTNSVLCGYTTSTEAGNFYAGGIMGYAEKSSASGAELKISISSCYNTAMIKAGNKSANANNGTGAAYAGGIVGLVASGVTTSCSDVLNQGFIEALGSTANAKTDYEINDSNQILFKYNTEDITNVYANTFGTNISPSLSANYGEAYKNGLYGIWTSTPKDVKFDVLTGSDESQGLTFKGTYNAKDKKIAKGDYAWYQIGDASEAKVYIQQTDDLGSPLYYYVTVPRYIYFGGLTSLKKKIDQPNDDYGQVATRAQEIYFANKIEDIDTYNAKAHYNTITEGSVCAFMSEDIPSEVPTKTKIGGTSYAVANSAGTFLNAITSNTVQSTITIDAGELETCYGKGYKLEVKEIECTASEEGYAAMFDSIFGQANFGEDSKKIHVKIACLVKDSAEEDWNGSAKQPTFTFKIIATHSEEEISCLLEKSSLIWDGSKTTIYLDNMPIVDDAQFRHGEDRTYSGAGIKDHLTETMNGRTYNVSVGGNTYSMTYNYKTNSFSISADLRDQIGKTISFNLYENDTFECEHNITNVFNFGTKIAEYDVTLYDSVVFDSKETNETTKYYLELPIKSTKGMRRIYLSSTTYADAKTEAQGYFKIEARSWDHLLQKTLSIKAYSTPEATSATEWQVLNPQDGEENIEEYFSEEQAENVRDGFIAENLKSEHYYTDTVKLTLENLTKTFDMQSFEIDKKASETVSHAIASYLADSQELTVKQYNQLQYWSEYLTEHETYTELTPEQYDNLQWSLAYVEAHPNYEEASLTPEQYTEMQTWLAYVTEYPDYEEDESLPADDLAKIDRWLQFVEDYPDYLTPEQYAELQTGLSYNTPSYLSPDDYVSLQSYLSNLKPLNDLPETKTETITTSEYRLTLTYRKEIVPQYNGAEIEKYVLRYVYDNAYELGSLLDASHTENGSAQILSYSINAQNTDWENTTFAFDVTITPAYNVNFTSSVDGSNIVVEKNFTLHSAACTSYDTAFNSNEIYFGNNVDDKSYAKSETTGDIIKLTRKATNMSNIVVETNSNGELKDTINLIPTLNFKPQTVVGQYGNYIQLFPEEKSTEQQLVGRASNVQYNKKEAKWRVTSASEDREYEITSNDIHYDTGDTIELITTRTIHAYTTKVGFNVINNITPIKIAENLQITAYANDNDILINQRTHVALYKQTNADGGVQYTLTNGMETATVVETKIPWKYKADGAKVNIEKINSGYVENTMEKADVTVNADGHSVYQQGNGDVEGILWKSGDTLKFTSIDVESLAGYEKVGQFMYEAKTLGFTFIGTDNNDSDHLEIKREVEKITYYDYYYAKATTNNVGYAGAVEFDGDNKLKFLHLYKITNANSQDDTVEGTFVSMGSGENTTIGVKFNYSFGVLTDDKNNPYLAGNKNQGYSMTLTGLNQKIDSESEYIVNSINGLYNNLGAFIRGGEEYKIDASLFEKIHNVTANGSTLTADTDYLSNKTNPDDQFDKAVYTINQDGQISIKASGSPDKTEYKAVVVYVSQEQAVNTDGAETTEPFGNISAAISGIILQANIDLKGSDTGTAALKNLSGNKHFINYYSVDKSLFTQAVGHIKDVSFGANIMITAADKKVGLVANEMGSQNSSALLRNVATYGSISTSVVTIVLNGIEACGVAATMANSTTLNDVNSYVNFSSYFNEYAEEDKANKFVGIAPSTIATANNVAYHGVLIGYDGKDSNTTETFTLAAIKAKKTGDSSGKAGQSVDALGITATTSSGVTASGVVRGGKGGNAAPGRNGLQGRDYIGGDDVKITRGADQNGSSGGSVGAGGTATGGTAGSAGISATTGLTGWNGVNLYKYSVSQTISYKDIDDDDYFDNNHIYKTKSTCEFIKNDGGTGTYTLKHKIFHHPTFLGNDAGFDVDGNIPISCSDDTVTVSGWISGGWGYHTASKTDTVYGGNIVANVSAFLEKHGRFVAWSRYASCTTKSTFYVIEGIIGFNGTTYNRASAGTQNNVGSYVETRDENTKGNLSGTHYKSKCASLKIDFTSLYMTSSGGLTFDLYLGDKEYHMINGSLDSSRPKTLIEGADAATISYTHYVATYIPLIEQITSDTMFADESGNKTTGTYSVTITVTYGGKQYKKTMQYTVIQDYPYMICYDKDYYTGNAITLYPSFLSSYSDEEKDTIFLWNYIGQYLYVQRSADEYDSYPVGGIGGMGRSEGRELKLMENLMPENGKIWSYSINGIEHRIRVRYTDSAGKEYECIVHYYCKR